MTRDGLLLVDKPAGVTSHDVVNVARRAIGERRIGHTGTLDPFATGLLVLLVGRATRLIPHVPGEPKVYDATIRFGAETDTEDLGGTVVREAPLPGRDALLGAVAHVIGEFEQMPPAYSAKRVGGKRAYDLARAGVPVELTPVSVLVEKWELSDAVLVTGGIARCEARVWCSAGTYVRSLARDLARAAGSAAHLSALRRLATGPFHVDAAVTLDALRDGAFSLRPAADAVPQYPVQGLDATDVRRATSGIAVAARVDGDWVRLTDGDGGPLVALAQRDGNRWQPRVVMHVA